jgi:hypothetical protein
MRTRRQGWAILFALFALLGICGAAQAQELEGTWKLVMRKLPDGTKLVPPAVFGLWTAHNGLRNLNVFWHTPDGNPASFASASTYKISDTEYTETLFFNALDEGNGKPPTYNLKGDTEKTPVTRDGSRIAFQLPFGEPSVVFEGDKFTATIKGPNIIDYWERVH